MKRSLGIDADRCDVCGARMKLRALVIYRYKRAARTHAELNLGTLVPLVDAITELRKATTTSPQSA